MEINTKFEIGSTVSVLYNGEILSGEVLSAVITAYKIPSGFKYDVMYSIHRYSGSIQKNEKEVYATKADAAIEWVSQQGMSIGVKED